MADEYTPDGPLVIEGIIEDGEFRQTNGQSFNRWLAAHDRAVKAETLREAAADASGDEQVIGWLTVRANAIEAEATE